MKKETKDQALMIVFIMLVIAASELIGIQIVNVGKIAIMVLPLVYAVLITMLFGIPKLRKGIFAKIYTASNIKFAAGNLIFIMLPLMARYGADVAPKINEIMEYGWVFLLQSAGNVGTVILGLPVALLLGLNREAIGATLGIGREGELAFITEKFSLDSEEGRGVLSMYLVGTLFGALMFSFIPPIFSALGFSYKALAIASGLGSASMMTASSSAIVGLHPQVADTITSFAGASQLVTSFMGTYIMVFLSAPLMNFMYKLLKKERAID